MIGVTGLRRAAPLALAIAAAVLLAGSAAWLWRLDTLRGGYRARLSDVAAAIGTATQSPPPKFDRLASEIAGLAAERDTRTRERDSARTAVAQQTASIRALEAEGRRLAAIGEQNRAVAASLIEERSSWIARARAAEGRTERLTCERELEEVNAALDVLYRAGF